MQELRARLGDDFQVSVISCLGHPSGLCWNAYPRSRWRGGLDVLVILGGDTDNGLCLEARPLPRDA